MLSRHICRDSAVALRTDPSRLSSRRPIKGTRDREGFMPSGLSARKIHRIAWPMSDDVAHGPAWLGTISPAFPQEQPEAQSGPLSSTVTLRPRLLSSRAMEAPTAPAPMTAPSVRRSLRRSNVKEVPPGSGLVLGTFLAGWGSARDQTPTPHAESADQSRDARVRGCAR